MIKIFKKSYTKEEKTKMRFLKKNRLFENLTDKEVYYFLPCINERMYAKNEIVFFSGDPSQALYIVKMGKVVLNIELKNTQEKLLTIRSGQLFGDNALLENTKRIYSAVVDSEKANLLVLPRVNILEILNSKKTIKSKIMTSYCEYFNEYNTKLFKIYKKSFGFFDIHEVYA